MPADKDMETRKPTRADIEIHRINAEAAKISSLYRLVYNVLKLAAGVLCIYIVFEALVGIATKSPSQISAVAQVIDAASNFVHANLAIPWILFVLALVVICIYRIRVRSLIHKCDQLRREMEKQDPARSSSGLDKYGETPRKAL